MPVREDWAERQVKLLAQALARILGLRRRGRIQASIAEADAAMAALAGMDPKLLAAIGAAEVASRLGDPARVAALARLADERAQDEGASGDEVRAAASRRLALELWLEAALGGADLGGEARARVAALLEGAGPLPPRYAELAALARSEHA